MQGKGTGRIRGTKDDNDENKNLKPSHSACDFRIPGHDSEVPTKCSVGMAVWRGMAAARCHEV